MQQHYGTSVELGKDVLENLAKLSDYLLALPEDYKHFEMESFSQSEHGIWAGGSSKIRRTLPNFKSCGTAACACGHGPAAGIPPRDDESWADYAERCFTGGDVVFFDFMFSGQWKYWDNTPHGAARRIKYFLEHKGVPIPTDTVDPVDVEYWDTFMRAINDVPK